MSSAKKRTDSASGVSDEVGMEFGIDGAIEELLLIAAGKTIHRDTAWWELLTNAMEALATLIRIWALSSNRFVIADNGHGLSAPELQAKLFNWVSSGKTIAALKNMGIGFKLIVALGFIRNVTFTSRAKDSKDYYQVRFGQIRPGKYGPLCVAGQPNVFVQKVQAPYGGKFNTYVEFDLSPEHGSVTPVNIIRSINQRIWAPNCKIEVSNGKNSWTEVVAHSRLVTGSYKLDKVGQPMSGKIELDHSDVLFGIRKENYRNDLWAAPNFSIVHLRPDCVYGGNTVITGGQAKLSNWGITAGFDEISLVVIPKGPDINVSLGRDMLHGWDEEEAAREFQARFPILLSSFIEVFSAENRQTGDKERTETVLRYLSERGITLAKKSKSRTDPDPNGVVDPITIKPGRERDDEKPKPKPNNKKKKKEDAPVPVFTTSKMTGAASLLFEPVNAELWINVDVEIYQLAVIEAQKAGKLRDFEVMVAVGVIAGWVHNIGKYFEEKGYPSPYVLDAIYYSAVQGARVGCLSGKGSLLERINRQLPRE